MKTIAFAALAIGLTGCASLGNPTDKSPSQLRAEREARIAKTPLPMTDNIKAALADASVERGVASVNALPDSPQ
jgi:hypothetical protein